MSDERCGPWVYASKRRRSRECRSWNMTDEELTTRREHARRVGEALAASMARFRSDAAAYLERYDSTQVVHFHIPQRTELPWWFGRTPETYTAFDPAPLLHGESTANPVPMQERTRITPGINDRARKLVASALKEDA